MTKFLLYLYLLVITICTVTAYVFPQSSAGYFVRFLSEQLVPHIAVITILLLYIFMQSLRTPFLQKAIGLLGICLIALSIFGMFGENYWFSLPLDTFFLLEGGILTLLVAAELPLASRVWMIHKIPKHSMHTSKHKHTGILQGY